MLTALENGVKGNVWFSLIDKVYAPTNLAAACAKVSSNQGAAGVDHVTVGMFQDRVEAHLRELSEQLRTGQYRPQAIRRVHIPKPDGTQRPLGIPTVRDRVAQTALRHVLEPIFEKEFARHSYGFRPGRGCKDALREVDRLLHPDKTRIVDEAEEPFEFLGYRFERGRRWPRQKSLMKLKEAIRRQTRRANGRSLPQIIRKVNPVLRGWFGYFKHSYKTVFPSLDGWVRMRLRSILRKRRDRRGPGRGSDHQRWPNRHFAALGLYSLQTARERCGQPA